MIDDNVGRVFRDLACDALEQDVEAVAPADFKELSIVGKRKLMVKTAHQALLTWQDSERYLAIGMRAALRTGMAMRIDDACAGVRPTRFPEGYESTIPTASGAPVRSYFNQPPAAPTIAVLEIPRSHEGPVFFTSLGDRHSTTYSGHFSFCSTGGAFAGNVAARSGGGRCLRWLERRGRARVPKR
jgi:hypothetical protein